MRPLIRNALKVGVAFAGVELTARYGLWKDSDTAQEGFQEAKHSVLGTVVPSLKPYLEKIPLPEIEVPKIDWRENWNRGVLCVFSSLDSLPGKTCDLFTSGWNKIKDFAAK